MHFRYGMPSHVNRSLFAGNAGHSGKCCTHARRSGAAGACFSAIKARTARITEDQPNLSLTMAASAITGTTSAMIVIAASRASSGWAGAWRSAASSSRHAYKLAGSQTAALSTFVISAAICVSRSAVTPYPRPTLTGSTSRNCSYAIRCASVQHAASPSTSLVPVQSRAWNLSFAQLVYRSSATAVRPP